MSEIAGNSMQLAAGALKALSVGMQVACHNVANISTSDFRPQTAVYATGSKGVGVEIQTVYGQRESSGETGIAASAPGGQASGTELAREFVHVIATQRSFEANAAVIRTADDITGAILNLKA